MIHRIVSVWIAIASAAAVAILCFALAGEAARPILYRGAELPLISKAFYPGSMLIYLYPLPLGVWALVHTIRSRDDRDQSLLIVTATLSISFVFFAAFALALALPYIPGAPSVLR
jgi:cytochrome c biogenesis factor